jgi:large subunit ribosomal protein L17
MRHLKQGRKLSRKIGQRKALLRGLLGSLLEKEKITTTEAKAKELKKFAERVISQAKKILSAKKEESLFAVRKVSAKTPSLVTKSKLEEIAKRFSGRKGGCTRIIKLPSRRSDGAKMAIIEILKD